MTTINYYIGLNDKDEHKQLFTNDEAKLTITTIFGYYYDSFTMSECIGVYKGELENTIKVKVMSNYFEHVRNDKELITMLKDYLNQECIGIEETQSNVSFE